MFAAKRHQLAAPGRARLHNDLRRIGRYRRMWEHAAATIDALAIDALGHVPWWPRPDVKLFNVMVHVLTETSRR
ncbi:DUF664 domain-containing protein [Micromonospora aurantiaca (nom. illeg.)]